MEKKAADVLSAEELHAFGNFLMRSKDEMITLIRGVVAGVYRVNEVWKDQVNQEFTEDFNSYIDQVEKLVELLESHSQFVHKKATAIEHYNNIR